MNRARNSKSNVPDTHVHALAYIPQLIDRFCALAGAAGDPVPDLKRSRSSSPHPRPSSSRTRRTSPRDGDASPYTPVAFCPGFGDPGFSLRAPGSNNMRSSGHKRPSAVDADTRSELSPISITLSDSSLAVASPSESASRAARNVLNLTICDHPISLNLEGMEYDPKGIISLLELSNCERDKWFITAGHYRRRGNPIGAVNVLTSMMKGDRPPILCVRLCCQVPNSDIHPNVYSVFRELGVTDEDMKPAFLMISACHGDQAKRTRDSSGLNTPESTRHYQLSLTWMRKVYGTPGSEIQASFVGNSPRSDSSRNRDEKWTLPPRPALTPAPVPQSTSPQSSHVNRIRTLEHQVGILRKRATCSEKSAAESEALKRKYEQDLSHEKSKRRKVEMELDEVSAELKAAKRMEKYASDLAKRETEFRRRAETREKGLARRIEVLEKEKKRVSDGGKAVLFEDLANIFQKAAHGQGDGSTGSLRLSLEPGEENSSFGGP